MKITRKIIEIDQELCNGCGQCVPSCAEGALEIVDGKARMLAEKYCDGLGACLGECPEGALRIVERMAEDFDEEAVEELLKTRQPAKTAPASPAPGGCPSSRLQMFSGPSPCQAANMPQANDPSAESSLSHWPVQIRLVPPGAPFLKNCDLLVAADCTAVSYPDFHRDFLSGRAVLMGCPKFDDVPAYVEKFREIFEVANPSSVTLLMMEVPCCANLRNIVSEAMEKSGRRIPVSEAVIGVRGGIISRRDL